MAVGLQALRETVDAQERRTRPRLAVALPGRIAPFDLACRILDLSAEGARLQMDGEAALPAEFVLVEMESGWAHLARIAWRRGAEVGVRFMRSCPLQGPTPPEFAEAEALWLRQTDAVGVTTFAVQSYRREWAVMISSAALAEPAVLRTFAKRWEAERFAAAQIDGLRSQGLKGVLRDQPRAARSTHR